MFRWNYILNQTLNICTFLFHFNSFFAKLCVIIITITVTIILTGHYYEWQRGMNDTGDVVILGWGVLKVPWPQLPRWGMCVCVCVCGWWWEVVCEVYHLSVSQGHWSLQPWAQWSIIPHWECSHTQHQSSQNPVSLYLWSLPACLSDSTVPLLTMRGSRGQLLV